MGPGVWPALPQHAPKAQSNAQLNAQRSTPSSQQNTTGGSTRPANAQPQSNRQAQSNVQPVRASASSRGRGGNYAQQVTAARHPKSAGGHRRGFNQTSPSQARTQASGANRPRAPSAPTDSCQASSCGYQRDSDRARHGVGYRGSDQSSSGICRPVILF